MQQWVNLVETNCAPARETEFHEWYNNVHIPHRLKTPGYAAVARYEAGELREGRGKYLTLYNVQSDDLDSTLRARRAGCASAEKARLSIAVRDNLATPVWKDLFWRQLSEQLAGGYKKSGLQRWVMLVEVHCTPSRESEFNDWYDNIHVPDVLKTPGYAGARRYVIRDAKDGRGKYLAIYYIETDDIEQTRKARRARREIEDKLGRSSNSLDDLTIKIWRNVLWKEIYRRSARETPLADSPFAT